MSPDDHLETEEDKRSYYRVSTFLPVRCRVIEGERVHAVETEIATRSDRPDLTRMDPALRAWLSRLEDKIDELLSHYETEENGWITAPGSLEVTLSGAGIRVPVLTEVAEGTDVLIDLVIPGMPKQRVLAIGEVARCTKGKQIEIAMGFRAISLGDRDAVVGHVLEIQRNELRKRSEG